MALRTKIFILVVLVGVLLLGLSVIKQESPDWRGLFSAGLIAAIVNALLVAFNHYGWRCPGLSFAATSPNLRGTWRFESARVFSMHGDKPKLQAHLVSGFVVIKQSDTHIGVTILWDGDEPSAVPRLSPVTVNEGKLCFTGTFLEYSKGYATEHAYATFITYADRHPTEFSLRYRTDSELTGSLTVHDRKPWNATSRDAQARAKKKASVWGKLRFALSWT